MRASALLKEVINIMFCLDQSNKIIAGFYGLTKILFCFKWILLYLFTYIFSSSGLKKLKWHLEPLLSYLKHNALCKRQCILNFASDFV